MEEITAGSARLELLESDEEDDEKLEGPTDTEDEEDDEDEEPTVVVGFVQKPDKPWLLSRQYFPSKAGGVPAWLDPDNLPRGQDMLCGICEKPLQFLLQVYAPVEGEETAFHRTLFVFMCTDMSCLQEDRRNQKFAVEEEVKRSVKVFRCQLPRINDYYSKDPPQKNGADTPVTKGACLCSWCGTWKGEKACGACKNAWYCSRSHQVEHWNSSHSTICKEQKKDIIKSENGNAITDWEGDLNSVPASRRLWREFEIVDEEEGCEEDENAPGQLIASGNARDEISSQFQAVQPTAEQQHWANFQTRISRAPDQILRYCRSPDAKPLWPRFDERPLDTSIPPCEICNGRRIFEFQVLPQLLYFFKIRNDPDALDWGTIAIFSCESSCKSSKAYVEEFAWVQST